MLEDVQVDGEKLDTVALRRKRGNRKKKGLGGGGVKKKKGEN